MSDKGRRNIAAEKAEGRLAPKGRASNAPVRLDAAIRPLGDKEFRLFQALIYREAGIHLSAAKKALLAGRLTRRVRDLGLGSFGAYYEVVAGGDDEERVRMLDCISTNETEFFREPKQFALLESHVFPEWRAREAEGLMPRRIRIWSAGCSTGEEAYSLAMTALAHFPPSCGWKVEVLATDLSTRALARAREAIWPADKAKKIPLKYLRPFMLKGIRGQSGRIAAGPEIRAVVSFHRLNLNQNVYPIVGPFDLIFCRNVLIYFDTASKTAVVRRLLGLLAPTGYLFLGHAESLNGVTGEVQSVIPTVYAFMKATGKRGDRCAHGDAAGLEPLLAERAV